MDIVATLFQLVGGVLLAIDACMTKDIFNKLSVQARDFVGREFASIDDYKKAHAIKLVFIYLGIILVAIALTAITPFVTKWIVTLPILSLEVSLVSGFAVAIVWLFSVMLVFQGFIYFSPNFYSLLKHYFGVFLLLSNKGPLYVLGFIFLVVGYSIQLAIQVHDRI